MERRGTKHSAPYGQACISCFTAKTRCILRSDSNECERCHRLKKQCVASNAIRRRTVDNKQDPDGRIARLESLVLQLQSSQIPERAATVQVLQHEHTPAPLATRTTPAPESPPDHMLTMNSAITSWESSTLSVTACLDTFRSHMLPYFPFIHLPAHLTAHRLQDSRPFLLRAIICVASPTAPEKQAHAAELERALCERAFLAVGVQHQPQPDENGFDSIDRTMDTLLGLLTYAAWGWDHLLSRGSLSRLVMLSMSLVGEMRLDKPMPPHLGTMTPFAPSVDGLGAGGSSTTTQQSSEHQRAALGCFVLSAVVSAYFAQMDGLRWTPQLEESLVALSTNKEYSTDAILALQVRLQLLAGKALQPRESHQQTNRAPATRAAASATAQVEELREELQGLQNSYSLNVKEHQDADVVLAQMSYIELCILESIPLGSSTGSPITSYTPDDAPNTNHPHNDDQLPSRWASVQAINACISGLLTLSPSGFRGLPFPQWAHLSGCIAVLHRFDNIRGLSSSQAHNRGLVDISIVLDCLANKLELASAEAGEQGPNNVFMQLAARVHVFNRGMPRREAVDGPANNIVPVAPQKGYFRNPRFWLDQFFTGTEG